MEKIFELAKQLGESLAEHPIGKRYHGAKDILDADSSAKTLIQEYEQIVVKLGQKEKQGKPIEPEEKRMLTDLQSKLAGNESVKKWMESQVEYMNLLRQINDQVMKEVQDVPTK
jgi:cell fate (sporulation/competence/biofilm development) regulator YlbF (YheA/YmcA/DUF963 family)